ncbi:MAG TPA: acyltransferase [Terriglobales bacterium]|nr:acyltransferase [Terriglobales bacterium]
MDQSPKTKLNALTSLRFVAAAMIVFQHSYYNFAKYVPFKGLQKTQAVSFFFVLSGFILSYVYPNLNSFADVRRFLVARFARIWPAHIFALILVLVLIPRELWIAATGSSTHPVLKSLANICMVHAWFPDRGYCYAFNSPSWSISTEFFFYLCFPVLIYKWKDSWKIKLLAAAVLTLSVILLARALGLTDVPSKHGISIETLLYVNPLPRLLEFTLGMTVFLAWEKLRLINIGRVVATFLELLAVGAALAGSYWVTKEAHSADAMKWMGMAGKGWFLHSGSLVFFAFLILIIALEKGLVSKTLSLPFAVVLGEISFSVYLIHLVLLGFYRAHADAFSTVPDWLAYIFFWVLLLVTAHLVWRIIELSARRYLVDQLAPARAQMAGNTNLHQKRHARKTGHTSAVEPSFRKQWLVMELLLLGGLVTTIALNYNPR